MDNKKVMGHKTTFSKQYFTNETTLNLNVMNVRHINRLNKVDIFFETPFQRPVVDIENKIPNFWSQNEGREHYYSGWNYIT